MKDLLPGAFVRTCRTPLLVLAFVLFAATAARAQVITSNVGGHLGTYSTGEVSFQLFASGGNGGPYTWTVQSGALPPGVALRTDLPSWMGGAQAALWGIATATGDYAFTLRASDGTNPPVDFPTQMRITGLLLTNPFNLPDAYVGTPYSYQLTTDGALAAVTFTDTTAPALPAGFSLSNTGLLTINGAPAGQYNVNFSITDGTDTIFRGINVFVSPLKFVAEVLPNATEAAAYASSVDVTGGTAPYTFALNGGGLPFGLTLNGSGAITGTLNTGPGKYSFNVSVTDSSVPANTYSRNIVIVVVGNPKRLPNVHPYGGELSDCTIATECSRGLHVNNGGVPPFAWTATGLPPGMSIGTMTANWGQPLDGEIRGFPTTAGNYNVTVTVTDADGSSATNTFPLRISPMAPRHDGGPAGTLGAPMTFAVRIIGGTPFAVGAPYTATLVGGRLAQGLSFNPATLSITGTPAENGWFNPVFEILDSTGAALRTNVSFFIGGNGPTISHSGDLGSWSVGSFFSQQLNACCAPGYTWSVIGGAMPPEMTLSSGGTLNAPALNTPGTYSFLVQVMDTATSNVGATLFTIRVSPLSSDFFDLGYANVGTPYSFPLTVNGATAPVTWTVEPFSYLPPGLQVMFNAGAWSLTGTPTATGQFNFSLRVTDSNNHTLVRHLTLSVYPAGANPPVGIPENGDLGLWSIGEIHRGLTPSGGNGSYTWSIVSGALPPGVALRTPPYLPPWFSPQQKAGLIGIATTPGTYNFRVQVVSGASVFERDFTMRITGFTIDDQFVLPDTFVGHPFTVQLTSSGHSGGVTWAATAPLPPGVSLTPGGELSSTGAGLVAGFYGVSLSANDGTETVFRTLSLSVFAVKITTAGELPTGAQGVAYSTTVAATFNGAPCAFPTCTFSSNAPFNVAVASDGTVTIPATAGSGRYGFDVTATAPGGISYSRRMAVVIVPNPVTLPSLAGSFTAFDDCSFGIPCSRTMSISNGGAPPYTWTISGLPAGLTYRTGSAVTSRFVTPGDVEIVGNPRQIGDFPVTVTVTDASGGSATQTYPFRVSALAGRDFFNNADRGVAFEDLLRIIGGVPGYTATIVSGRLPAGLSLNSATQFITGTPQENGNFFFAMEVVDSAAPANLLRVSRNLNVGAGTSTISISTTDLGSAVIGSPFFGSLFACCVPGTFTWSLASGTLPTGLQLNSATGQVTGTVDPGNAPGVYTFRFVATHSTNANNFGVRDVTLRLTTLSINAPSSTLPDGNVGTPYAAQFTAAGAGAAATWSLGPFNLLPPGLTLSSNGALSGTPETSGQYFFSVVVTEGASVATRTFGVSIYPAGETRPLAIVNFGPISGERGIFTRSLTSFNVTGGQAPYTFSLTPDAELPPGAAQIPGMRILDDPPFPTNFSPASTLAVYAGVIAEPGVYTPSIRVTDALNQTFDRVITVTVTPLAILSQSQLPFATRNVPYSFQFEVTEGSGNYVWSAGTLPSGLALNPTSGLLSGTPTSSGSPGFTLVVTDQQTGASTSGFFTLPINPYAFTTSGTLPPATSGVPYSVTLAAPCGSGCTWSVIGGQMPRGLSLNSSTGVLSGTPSGPSQGTFRVLVNGSAGSSTRQFSIAVLHDAFPVLRIANTTVGDHTVGVPVSVALTAQGGAPPYSWTVDSGNLPPGVSLVSDGENYSNNFGTGLSYFTGKGLIVGTYTFTLRVEDSAGQFATRAFNWKISPLSWQFFNLPISGAPLVYNQAYSQPLLVLGGSNVYTAWSHAGMPPGLAVDASTGVVNGTPVNTGVFSSTIGVTDSDGNQTSAFVNLTIASGVPGSLIFPNQNLGVVQIGATAAFNIAASGSGVITYTALSPLPAGFVLTSSADPVVGGSQGSVQLTGAPTAPGTYTFTLRADSTTGAFAVRTFSFTVSSFVLPGNQAVLPDTFVGDVYSRQLVAFSTGAAGTWAVSAGSQLPPGLSLSSAGLLSGTPAQAGLFSFAVDVTDAFGTVSSRTFTLNVSAVALSDAGVLPVAMAGVPYSHTFSGGGAGVFWTVSPVPPSTASPLPPGLTLSPAGVLAGTTSTRGTFSFIVTANDGARAISRRFTLYVRLAIQPMLTIAAQTTDLGSITVGQNATFTLNVSNGAPPYAWSVAAGSSLPPGMVLADASLLTNLNPGAVALTGTPSAAGVYTFDLVVTDAAGLAARRTYTLGVSSFPVLGGSPPPAVAGVPYSVKFVAPGAASPIFSAAPPDVGISSPLPPGMTLAANGTLAGTPASTGSYQFALVVQDGATTYRKLVTLTVNNAGGLRSTNGPVFRRAVGGGVALRLTTTAAAATNFTWTVVSGTPPPGVVLTTGLNPAQFPNSTWLAGRGTIAGEYTFTVRATEDGNPANVIDHQFTMTISPMQFVAPAWELFNVFAAPSGRVGEPYSFTFKVAGGVAPYTFTESTFDPLPAGLTLGSNGVLSGVPAAGAIGSYAITPIVTDANGATMFADGVTLVIAPAGTAAPLLRSGNVTGASVGVPYGFALDSLLQGGTGPFTWHVPAGETLPAGLSLIQGANGVSSYLAGTPTAESAPVAFSLEVTDAGSPAQTMLVPVSMRVTSIALVPDALPNGTTGSPYFAAISPTGAVAPYIVQLAASSALPPGLAFTDGWLLSGTPTSPGNFPIQMFITDATGATLSKTYVVTIDNAAGEAPAISVSPKPINVYYEIGAPAPAAISVSVTSTSSALPFAAFMGPIPGATLTGAGGTTPGSLNLTFAPAGVTPGTYATLIATKATGAVNLGDFTPVTFTVAPAPPCTYSVSPEAGSIGATGGSGSFTLSAGYTCGWTATSSASWLHVSASGVGSGVISFTADPNGGVNTPSRTGTITVNGAVYTLTQFGTDALNCSFVISPLSVSATSAGGIATVDVTASSPLCAWTASSATMPLSVPGGTGNGAIDVTVPPFDGLGSRTLTATIAGHAFSAVQSGVDCTVTLSPYSNAAPFEGTTGVVDVTTPAACSYSTVLGPSWLHVTSGATGTGSGQLFYSVDENTTTLPRTGSLTIGGQTFNVTQAARPCTVTVDTAGLGTPYGSGSANGTIGVAANGANCGWSASSNVPWASIAPVSGTGNATVTVFVSSNAASTVSRAGSITIAGQTINISQAGTACSFALETTTGAAPASGGAGTVRVIAPAACTWAASSNDTWLSIVSSGAGGTSDVQFAASANPSATPRSGSLTIAGLTYTVNQAGAPCSYTIDAPTTSPTLANTGAAGQSFTFFSGFPGCSPTAVSHASWITIDNTSFAGLAGSVTYSVQPNPNATARTGTIIVGNAVFTVVQSGSPCAFSLNAYGRIFHAAGGSETVHGSPTAAGCTPDVGTDQPSFIQLFPLTGPVFDIFSLPYSVAPFPASLTTGVRFGRITFGGQIVFIKQYSW